MATISAVILLLTGSRKLHWDQSNGEQFCVQGVNGTDKIQGS